MKLSLKQIHSFQKTVWAYYKKHGRRFPWRETRDPYAILVSEVMLQQTQADRVVPKYREWMKKFPTVEELARAPLKKALLGWQGLGYNRRALHLKRAAEMIVKEYDGVIPRDIEKIDALPGVGPYTAGAIAVFAFGIPSAFIETNIRTVYLHFFFKRKREVRDEEILELVQQTLPKGKSEVRPLSRFEVEPLQVSVREWYNALMDYGAMLKETVGNPNIHSRHYAKQSKFKGSRRELRGEIVRRTSLAGKITAADFGRHRTEWNAAEIISELVREGFLKKQGNGFTLA